MYEIPYQELQPVVIEEIVSEEHFSYADTWIDPIHDIAQKIFDNYMKDREFEDITEVDIIEMDSRVFEEIGDAYENYEQTDEGDLYTPEQSQEGDPQVFEGEAA